MRRFEFGSALAVCVIEMTGVMDDIDTDVFTDMVRLAAGMERRTNNGGTRST